MAQYHVTLTYTGSEGHIVEAESEQEAIEKAMEESDGDNIDIITEVDKKED